MLLSPNRTQQSQTETPSMSYTLTLSPISAGHHLTVYLHPCIFTGSGTVENEMSKKPKLWHANGFLKHQPKNGRTDDCIFHPL